MNGKALISSLLILGSVALLTASLTMTGAAESKKTDKALERTRKTVRMLDDIYKTTMVLITDKYVHDEDDFPAGSAAVALFKSIEKKGWHKVRLLDATGKPREGRTLPKTPSKRLV